MAQSAGYRPEIDGLRAVAVVPVILFHAGFTPFSGGYVGVDVFFVISGFLITTIILEDIESGTFSISRFYERRVRRILPALVFMILLCLPAAWVFMLPSEYKDFSKSLIAVPLFISNILFWKESGYFAPDAELKPLLHTWSLAVEEQFYIIFPILMLLLWRIGRVRLIWIMSILALVSLGLSEWGWRNAPAANFYLAPSRAWELIVGALCALVAFGGVSRRNNLLSGAGLFGLVCSVFLFDTDVPFPSVYTLLPVLGTALILVFAHEGTWVARLLGSRTLVGVGLISYSAYLWHQPLFAFARIIAGTEPSVAIMLSLSAASLFLAYVSWKLVEQPFRRTAQQGGIGRNWLFGLAIICSSVFICAGAAVYFAQGVPQRFPGGSLFDKSMSQIARIDNGYCFYSVDTLAEYPVGVAGLDCEVGEAHGASYRALLVGDSFAGHWEPFWDRLGEELGINVRAVTTNWCFPSLGDSFNGPPGSRAVEQCEIDRRWIKNNAADYDLLIVSGYWSSLVRDGLLTETDSFIKWAERSTKAKVLIMPSPVALVRRSVERVAQTGHGQLVLDEAGQSAVAAAHREFQLIDSASDRIKFLTSDQIFGGGGEYSGTRDEVGIPYSLDGAHVSIHGSLAAADHVLSSAVLNDIIVFIADN